MNGATALTSFLSNERVIDELKNFAGTLKLELSNICADIERLNYEKYRKVTQTQDVAQSIRSVANSAVLFVDSVDDLYYYCRETNFSEIKASAYNNDLNLLLKFVAFMDGFLISIGIKYESFRADCRTAIKECNAAADRCCRLQAEARTRRNATRVIGGVATTAITVGGTAASILAGVFTLGIGTAIGLPLTAAASATAGAVTHVVEKEFAGAEGVFREYSHNFSSLTSLAIDINDRAAQVHREVVRFDNSHRSLRYVDHHTYHSICTVLDRLYELAREYRPATANCLEEAKSCKENVNNTI